MQHLQLKKIPRELIRYIDSYIPYTNCIVCIKKNISYDLKYICSKKCYFLYVIDNGMFLFISFLSNSIIQTSYIIVIVSCKTIILIHNLCIYLLLLIMLSIHLTELLFLWYIFVRIIHETTIIIYENA
jgi:hypothetical protein